MKSTLSTLFIARVDLGHTLLWTDGAPPLQCFTSEDTHSTSVSFVDSVQVGAEQYLHCAFRGFAQQPRGGSADDIRRFSSVFKASQCSHRLPAGAGPLCCGTVR